MTPLVFSLNPAVDVEWRVPGILEEEKNELRSESRWPGGKGVNVARWLNWFGQRPRLFLTLGGRTGRELSAGLRAEGLRATAFRIRQETRANVMITPDRGAQLRFNPTWPVLDSSECRRLAAAACGAAAGARTVILSGTLAFGAPASLYARLVRTARSAGARVYLDCDREPFALAAREGPFLVKPNAFELAQWAGRPLRNESALMTAARELSTVTGGWVLVSRGAQGALLVNHPAGSAFFAKAPKVIPRNTVGAGDALLSGVIASVEAGRSPADWLADGVAAGTAATQVVPGRLPTQRLLRELRRKISVSGT